jgi:hypothetical protein
MHQVKFSIEQNQIDFLNQYKAYGFKDKSTMVRTALEDLKRMLERQQLKESANLYAEIYAQDVDLQEITEAATTGWPE